MAWLSLWSFGALGLAALIVWGWGLGPDGDLGFAVLVAAIGVACFVGGRTIGRWWLVPAVTGAWVVGWLVGGVVADPDGYTWAASFLAPLVAVFLALGTAAHRRAARHARPSRAE